MLLGSSFLTYNHKKMRSMMLPACETLKFLLSEDCSSPLFESIPQLIKNLPTNKVKKKKKGVHKDSMT